MSIIKHITHLPQTIFNHLRYPKSACILFMKRTAKMWPDELYLKIMCYLRLGYRVNLKNPTTFNEKLNWLKLHNRKPIFTLMADKYAVKKFVAERVGDEHVVTCYGSWNNADEIDFDTLTYPIVLKGTGATSDVAICHSREEIDIEGIRAKLNKSIKRNLFYSSREWPYKNVKSRVIAEKFLSDGFGTKLLDYKFWCFNGKPQIMYIANKGAHGKKLFENYYDMGFQPLNINHNFIRHTPEFSKPAGFEVMKSLCCKLLEGLELPFVRVDFFYVNGCVYFAEFTFFDWAGMRPFPNHDDDVKLGKMIDLTPLMKENNS